MHSELVAGHVLLLEKGRVRDGTGADDKERGLEVHLVEILEKVRRVGSRAIVVGETPGELLGADSDIGVPNTSTARPPAVAGVRSSLRVSPASTSHGRGNVGDRDARVLDILDPLLYDGRVGGGQLVESWVVCGLQVCN